MTAFANDRQEMGRIAALEAALDRANSDRQRMADDLFDCRNKYGCGPTGGEDIMSDSDIELTRLSSWGREALALEIIRLQAALDAAEKLAEELKASNADAKRTINIAFTKASENEQLWITATNRAEAAERALADANLQLSLKSKDLDYWTETAKNALRAGADALAAKAQAEEDAHYANGVTDLALQRRDTAEAQVAVLQKALQPFLFATSKRIGDGDYPDDYLISAQIPMHEIRKARMAHYAALPDSAAKLRAVVSEAERVSREHTGPLPDKHYILDMALDDLSKAVSAYKASRTEPSK
jgi:hypothetical protein